MRKLILLCLVWVLSDTPIQCQSLIGQNVSEGNAVLQLSIKLDSSWDILNSCRNADLLVTYRNNSEEPVMIVSPDNLDFQFEKGSQRISQFDGFTYSRNIHLWGIILRPHSQYSLRIPLRLFLKVGKLDPGNWHVRVTYKGLFRDEWIGSGFEGEVKQVVGSKIESLDRLAAKCSIVSDSELDHNYLVINTSIDKTEQIEMIKGKVVSNSILLNVGKCGEVEKLLWRIKKWFSHL